MLIRAAHFPCFCVALLFCSVPSTPAQTVTPSPVPPAINPDENPEGLINLDVTVTGRSLQPVLGIAPRAFALLEDGRPQPLVSVAASRPDQPFTVVVLLDTLEMEKPAAAVRSNGGTLMSRSAFTLLEIRNSGSSLSRPAMGMGWHPPLPGVS